MGTLLSNTNGDIVTQSPAKLEDVGVAAFRYRHFGSFAYVGDNKAVLQLPIIGETTPTSVHLISYIAQRFSFLPRSHTHTHPHTRHTEWVVDHVAVESLVHERVCLAAYQATGGRGLGQGLGVWQRLLENMNTQINCMLI